VQIHPHLGARRRRGGCDPAEGARWATIQSGLPIVLKVGRFGPYVETNGGEKPRRSSLPKGWTPET